MLLLDLQIRGIQNPTNFSLSSTMPTAACFEFFVVLPRNIANRCVFCTNFCLSKNKYDSNRCVFRFARIFVCSKLKACLFALLH